MVPAASAPNTPTRHICPHTRAYIHHTRPWFLGIDAAIKPLLSHSTTGEFDSPPEYLPHVRVEPYWLVPSDSQVRQRGAPRRRRVRESGYIRLALEGNVKDEVGDPIRIANLRF